MILDTNAISALLSGDSKLEKALASAERHHLPVIALGEYRFGIQASRHRKSVEPLLDLLERESYVLPVTSATSRMYSIVRLELKQDGHPIPENDIWIAALARELQIPVVTGDEHFKWVRGIRIVAW